MPAAQAADPGDMRTRFAVYVPLAFVVVLTLELVVLEPRPVDLVFPRAPAPQVLYVPQAPGPPEREERVRLDPGRRASISLLTAGHIELFDLTAQDDAGDDEATTDAYVRAERSGTSGEALGVISVLTGEGARTIRVAVHVHAARPAGVRPPFHVVDVRRGRVLVEDPNIQRQSLIARVRPNRDLQAAVTRSGRRVRFDLWPAPPGARPRDLLR